VSTESQAPQPAREEPWLAEGGPAFPVKAFDNMQFKGMSLRDYFAAKAMQSLLREPNCEMDELGDNAYFIADTMLKARSA
jgi:hypothetical protein